MPVDNQRHDVHSNALDAIGQLHGHIRPMRHATSHVRNCGQNTGRDFETSSIEADQKVHEQDELPGRQ